MQMGIRPQGFLPPHSPPPPLSAAAAAAEREEEAKLAKCIGRNGVKGKGGSQELEYYYLFGSLARAFVPCRPHSLALTYERSRKSSMLCAEMEVSLDDVIFCNSLTFAQIWPRHCPPDMQGKKSLFSLPQAILRPSL